MGIPLCSLYAKREGKPTELHPPHRLAMSCAIIAFSLLVVNFLVADDVLGVWLCATNLAIRFVEAYRTIQLHRRQAVLPNRRQHATVLGLG